MDAEAAKELERSARRSAGEGAIHPDSCPKLHLHGVAFAIPPRGGQIVPSFADEGDATMTKENRITYPEADALIQLYSGLIDLEHCEKCGQATAVNIKADDVRDQNFFIAAFTLAAKLLDRQYRLTPEQKSALLAFPADQFPQWMLDLIDWCNS